MTRRSQSREPTPAGAGAPSERPETPEATFEEALGELEKIVRDLEGGGVPLEKALAAYERGISCLQHCQKILSRAEKRLEILLPARQAGRSQGESGPAAAPAGEKDEATLEERLEDALERGEDRPPGDPSSPRQG